VVTFTKRRTALRPAGESARTARAGHGDRALAASSSSAAGSTTHTGPAVSRRLPQGEPAHHARRHERISAPALSAESGRSTTGGWSGPSGRLCLKAPLCSTGIAALRATRPPRPGDAAPDSCGRSASPGLAAAAVCSSMTHLHRGNRPLRGVPINCAAGEAGPHALKSSPLAFRFGGSEYVATSCICINWEELSLRKNTPYGIRRVRMG
jgi:hypothetical protein